MTINRQKLLKLYLREVEKICDECDWKTHFEPSEIIGIVANLLENNADLFKFAREKSYWICDKCKL